MPRGNNVNIPSGTAILTRTLTGDVRATLVVVNPNNGALFVTINGQASPQVWDFIVPSQSQGTLPGPWLSYGIFYSDQSGGGGTGNVTIYESDTQVDVPDYKAIGVARLIQQTNMDIAEGTVPANPGAGILRLWADGTNHLHLLAPSGTDELVIDAASPLGGVLTGFLPNPGLANNAVTNAAIATDAVDARTIIAGGVGNAELAALAVDTGKLAALAVTASKVVDPFVGLPGIQITGANVPATGAGIEMRNDHAGTNFIQSWDRNSGGPQNLVLVAFGIDARSNVNNLQIPDATVGNNHIQAGSIQGSRLNGGQGIAAYPAFYYSGPSAGMSTSSGSFVNSDLQHLGIAWTNGQIGLWIAHLQVQHNVAGGLVVVGFNVSGVGTFEVGLVTCPNINTDFPITVMLPLSLGQGTYNFVVQLATASGGSASIDAGFAKSYSYIINPRP